MSRKVVLDLCAGTGAWSEPWLEAGYNVRRIDLPTDVRLLEFPGTAHGILAAPPCTMFCRMRMCRGRPTDEQFREALSVVDACLRLVAVCKPDWWALENPVGYLKAWLGEPTLKFSPHHYGDPWTKATWLWGSFKPPKLRIVDPTMGPWIHRKKGKRGAARSDHENAITAPGFAQAFFEANAELRAVEEQSNG